MSADIDHLPWQVLERAPAASAVADPTGTVVFANEAFSTLWGFTDRRSVPGLRIGELPWEDAAAVDRIVAEVHGARIWSGELAVRRAHGSTTKVFAIFQMVAAGKDDPGQVTVTMVTIGVDATRQQATLESLQRSERQLRQAQQVAQIGSWELDVVTGRLEWSGQVFTMFEIDPAQFSVSFEAFLERVHPDDREALRSAYQDSLRTRKPYVIEHRVCLPGGGVKWVEERCETDFDPDGRALRSRGTVQDVSARHLQDIELRRFRQMVEEAPQEIWLTDDDLRVRYVNASAAASLAYPRDALIGMSLGDIDVRGAATVQQSVRARALAPARQPPQPEDVEHRAKDGRRVPKELRFSPFQSGAEHLGLWFAQDITERRRAEAAVAASESLLREVLDTYPGWVACVDDDCRYVYVNGRMARLLGISPEEAVGRRPEAFFGPQARADIRRYFERSRAGESPIRVERIHVGADGETYHVWTSYISGSASPANRGSRRFYAFGLDISELRRAEQRLSTVVQGAAVGLWEWHCQSGAIDVNDEFLALVGYRRDEVAGVSADWLHGLVAKTDRAARREAIGRMASGELPRVQLQYQARHRSGRSVWVLEDSRVVERDRAGRPSRVMGAIQDITTLKAQEMQLRELNAGLEAKVAQRTVALSEAKAQAERASAAKSEFLSRMSHELRTPLNAILGFSQLLQSAPLAEQDAESVEEVLRAGRHLLDLINEILDLATIEAGRVQLRLEPVPLDALARECVTLLGALAHQAGVSLHRSIPPDAAVVADRGRLKQVLLNVLSNAIKYNHRGGQVAVTSVAGDAGQLEIQVVDTGPGLTPNDIERVFQPFERLAAGRLGPEGTGIGLTVSQRLVEVMHGSIGVRSRPGYGSTFWVRLPASRTLPVGDRAEAAGAVAEASDQRAARRRHLVLYVEDNPSNQRLMARLLASRHDIELLVAGDAPEALRVVRARLPELVLLDIQLPVIDGYELLTTLRSEGVGVPVIAVSANAMPADLARGRSHDFAAYLTKPLDVGRLLQTLNAWLPA